MNYVYQFKAVSKIGSANCSVNSCLSGVYILGSMVLYMPSTVAHSPAHMGTHTCPFQVGVKT